MTTEDALTIIKQVCANALVNLADHSKIQEAIKTIEDKLSSKVVK